VETASCPAGASVVEFFDQFSPEFPGNRYDWYEQIRRETGPVFWSPHYGGFWAIIGHAEAMTVLRDYKTFSSKAFFDEEGGPCPVDGVAYQGVFVQPTGKARPMLEADPPEASEIRNILSPLFSKEALEKKRDRIQEFADACIDRHIASGKIDLCSDLAILVPTLVTLEFIGAPLEDYDWVATMHLRLTQVAGSELERVRKNLEQERDFLAKAIARHKDHRSDNIISALLNARDEGAPVTDDEILELVTLLLAAGIDTTALVTGSTLVVMTRFPELRKKLQDDPSMTSRAFAEFLRFVAPTQGLCRTVTCDTELGGQKLRKGDRVMIGYAASCRDPAAFELADEVVLDRKPNLHLAFGAGAHRCLGSMLAQLEFEVMINTILRRMPDFEVDLENAREFENGGIVCGYQTVPARFTPGKPLGIDPRVTGWVPVTG